MLTAHMHFGLELLLEFIHDRSECDDDEHFVDIEITKKGGKNKID